MTANRRRQVSLFVAATAAIGLFAAMGPAQSAPLAPSEALRAQVDDASDVSQVAVVVRRGYRVGPRGNGYRYRSTTVVRRAMAMAAGQGPAGIAGDRAARLPPVRRSASSSRQAPQPTRSAQRRRPACAGTTPIRPAGRDFGITARSGRRVAGA